MKGTYIFSRGTSCAPSRNMCVPPKKSTSQNEGHTYFYQGHKLCPQQKYVCPTKKKVLLRMKGTYIFARGTNCAPSKIRTYIDKCIHLLVSQGYIILENFVLVLGQNIFLLGVQVVHIAEVCVSHQKSTSQNEGKYLIK